MHLTFLLAGSHAQAHARITLLYLATLLPQPCNSSIYAHLHHMHAHTCTAPHSTFIVSFLQGILRQVMVLTNTSPYPTIFAWSLGSLSKDAGAAAGQLPAHRPEGDSAEAALASQQHGEGGQLGHQQQLHFQGLQLEVTPSSGESPEEEGRMCGSRVRRVRAAEDLLHLLALASGQQTSCFMYKK